MTAKRNIFLIFSLLFTGGFSAIRTYELLKMIDPTNGFFYDKFLSRGNMISLGLIGAFVVLIGLAIFVCCSSKINVPMKTRSVPLAVASFAYGVGLLVDVGLYISKTNSFALNVDFIICILKFIIAVIFFIWGVSLIKNIIFPGWLFLLPIIVSAAELILSYTKFNGLANVTEYLVDICLMAFTMCFWLFHARVCTNNTSRRSKFWAISFGSISIIFAALSTVPRYIVNYIDPTLLSTHSNDPRISNIMLAIYIFVFIGSILTVKNIDNDKTESENVEPVDAIENEPSVPVKKTEPEEKVQESKPETPKVIQQPQPQPKSRNSAVNLTADEVNNNAPVEKQPLPKPQQPVNKEKTSTDDLSFLNKSSDDLLNDILNEQ